MLTVTTYPMKNRVGLWAGAALLCLANGVSAMPLSEYGLVLLDDLNANSIHVHNRAFIGGDVIGGNAEFGTRLDKNTRDTSAEIAGNLNVGANVGAGYVTIGGSNNAAYLNCNGNGLSQGACVRFDTTLKGRAANLTRQLHDDTLNISRLESNGEVVLDGNQKTLRYTGVESVAVFSLDGALLFSQNSNWSLDHGSAETVVINVSGDILVNAGGVNFNTGFGANAGVNNIGAANILWNFHEAESIDFGSSRFNGSVLAAYADIRMWNDFDGSLAARSYQGAGQVHDYLFSGIDFPSTPPVAVAEPSALAILLAGLGVLALGRRRQELRRAAHTQTLVVD